MEVSFWEEVFRTSRTISFSKRRLIFRTSRAESFFAGDPQEVFYGSNLLGGLQGAVYIQEFIFIDRDIQEVSYRYVSETCRRSFMDRKPIIIGNFLSDGNILGGHLCIGDCQGDIFYG